MMNLHFKYLILKIILHYLILHTLFMKIPKYVFTLETIYYQESSESLNKFISLVSL